MTPLGFKRKELHDQPSPATPEKDWENEEVCPEVHAEGKLAIAMGAEDLKAGEKFIAPVEFKVEELAKVDSNGKVSYRMHLKMLAMGDIEVDGSDAGEEYEEEDAGAGVEGDALVAVLQRE